MFERFVNIVLWYRNVIFRNRVVMLWYMSRAGMPLLPFHSSDDLDSGDLY